MNFEIEHAKKGRVYIPYIYIGGHGGDNAGGGGSFCANPKARITAEWIGPGKCTIEKL